MKRLELRAPLSILLLGIVCVISACAKDNSVLSDYCVEPYCNWESTNQIIISPFAEFSFSHQSCAVFDKYAFFVANGRARIRMYNLERKRERYTLELKAVNGTVFHCNQSCFGVDRYSPTDFFPLLYISQRAQSDNRCFVEVYRILPSWDDSISDFSSFSIELVQTIFFPVMSYENSLGNANCTIDVSRGLLFTYSRNTNVLEDNYGVCKISQFTLPKINNKVIVYENEDIEQSFMIDCLATNMQGGCIQDGILYVGQGYNSVGYIYLNVVDLTQKILVKRFDLRQFGVYWEPEGCFFYDDGVMLSHSGGISKVVKL